MSAPTVSSDAGTPPEWTVTVGEQHIELAHASNAAAVRLRGDVADLELRDAEHAWTLPAHDLVPSRLEAVDFGHAERVREALLRTPQAADATRLGDWLLWREGDVVAVRHVSRDWALATYRDGNGWLVSIGDDAVGFVPSSMLDRPDDA